MNRRPLLIALFIAVAGYALCALLVPRLHPAARWNYQLDRATATERARAAALRFYGADTRAWAIRLKAEYQRQAAFYLTQHSGQAPPAFLSPVITTALLVEPDGEQRRLRIEMTASGQPVGFALQRAATGSPPAEAAPPAPEATRRAAWSALAQIAGDDHASFALVSEAAQENEAARFVWERTIDETLRLNIESRVRGQAIEEIRIRPVFAAHLADEAGAGQNQITLLDALNVLLVALVGMVALAFAFLFVVRREIGYRGVLVFFLALFLLRVASKIFGGEFEADLAGVVFDERGQALGSFRNLAAVLNILLQAFFGALTLTVLWGAGLTLARRANPARYASFAALLRGRAHSNFVGNRAAIGFLLGGLLLAIPYLLAASNLFAGTRPERPDAQLLVAPLPAFGVLLQAWLPFALFTIYGFLLPLFDATTSRPRLSRAVAFLFGCVWLGEAYLSQTTMAAALCGGALVALVADQIYWRFDFLTLIVAAVAADIANAAGALLLQPSATVTASGWRALGGLGALMALALIAAWRGRATQDEDVQAVAPIVSAAEQAEREQLVAEFNVARQAQQRMLPAAPPVIPGYSIAATCRPAREVGGDLYEFLTLPNERIGIVVADVSGKGVPAALYMTLTKGLLASIAENESDPAAILREVNRHLYEVCRRKVFVTMILAVLDPATRTLTYARAGHNHGIKLNAAARELELLKAAGIGLGLAGDKVFAATLRQETIKLEAGDALLLYSDGITEAMNAAGEEFGMERLMAAVERADGLSADGIRAAILTEINQFLGATPPQDDITLVALRVS